MSARRCRAAEDVDAAHPGGSVMDAAQGARHVFVDCGTFGTSTGVCRITRTLGTPERAGQTP